MSDDFDKPYDFQRLQSRVRPLSLRHATQIASTNDWARREVQSGRLRVPALLVADFQSAGRGRGTNAWWSAIGNLAATFLFPQNPRLPLGLLPLLAGLAVRRALVRLTNCRQIGLKWPNDLVVERRKLAGLLCERLPHVDLIGVGINVNAGSDEAPADLSARITSLSDLTGTVWDLTDVAGEVCHDLAGVAALDSETLAREMLEEYARHHWPTGKDVELVDSEWGPRIRGRCLGVDAKGQLLIETGQGDRSFLTGSLTVPIPGT